MNGSCRAETWSQWKVPVRRLSLFWATFVQRSHVKILCCCANDFSVHRLHSGEPPVSKSLWRPISQLFSLNYQSTTCQTLTIKMSATKISCPQKKGRNLLTNCVTAEHFRLKSMQQWSWYQRRITLAIENSSFLANSGENNNTNQHGLLVPVVIFRVGWAFWLVFCVGWAFVTSLGET